MVVLTTTSANVNCFLMEVAAQKISLHGCGLTVCMYMYVCIRWMFYINMLFFRDNKLFIKALINITMLITVELRFRR